MRIIVIILLGGLRHSGDCIHDIAIDFIIIVLDGYIIGERDLVVIDTVN